MMLYKSQQDKIEKENLLKDTHVSYGTIYSSLPSWSVKRRMKSSKNIREEENLFQLYKWTQVFVNLALWP